MAFVYKRASNGIVWARDASKNATFYLSPTTRRWVRYAPVPRGPSFVAAPQAARPPSRVTLPPTPQVAGLPVDQRVANVITAVSSNPIVQGGLDGIGAALGDPDLGGQVSTGAKLVSNVIVPAVNFIGDAIGGLFGSGAITEQQRQAQLAYDAGAVQRPLTAGLPSVALVPTPAMRGAIAQAS